MTYREWLEHCERELLGAGLFFGHGTDNARDEAAWLVLAATGQAVNGSFDRWDDPVSDRDGTAVSSLLERRIATRKPLAYLLGEAWFCGLKFRVNESVLVPRSPLAELIANDFAPWLRAERIGTVLDLCTGSGCIAVAIAVRMPWIRVDASDISPAALVVARQNIGLHGVESRVRCLRSDLFESLEDRCYDLVVSNPPYVSAQSWQSLPAEYRAEPRAGLVSGLEGLEIPLRILLQSPEYLSDEGVLICEVGENAEALSETVPGLPLTWLEFGHGGGGVFLVDREALAAHRTEIGNTLEKLGHVV